MEFYNVTCVLNHSRVCVLQGSPMIPKSLVCHLRIFWMTLKKDKR